MSRPMTLQEAKNLKQHEIYEIGAYNADGTARRWRITGATKTWKTRPNEFRIPLKHGLYAYGEITHNNYMYFSKTEPEPQNKKRKR
jgi:hypothetical protein